MAACATRCDEDVSGAGAPPLVIRPTTKKQQKISTETMLSTGHSPRMLAPRPPMRTPNQS
jgi:hypothetical protein